MNLDVGCGFDRNGQKKRGDIGIDINRGIADIIADGRRLPFKNESFDNISCYHALEHVPDPESMLIEINRVLKPNGKATIVYPVNARETMCIYTVFKHPFTLLNVIFGFWKEKFRFQRGMRHLSEITQAMIGKYFIIENFNVEIFQRQLNNLEWLLRRKIKYNRSWQVATCNCKKPEGS